MPTQILMPALSPTMEEGTLAKWLKKEGDAIRAGDPIAEIETDKATMEVEAVEDGTLGQILVQAGTEGVKVNTPIALLLADGESAGAPAPKANGTKAQPAAAVSPHFVPAEKSGVVAAVSAPPPLPAAQAVASTGDRIAASPLARRMAVHAGIDLATMKGSGPGGRIVKADIDAARDRGETPLAKQPAPRSAQPPASATPGPATAPVSAHAALPDARAFFAEGTYTDVPHDNIRKTIARRLTAAKRDVPHYYLTVDVELDALLALRKDLNAKSPKEGPGVYKLSVNDFVIRASALALKRVPGVNASWTDGAMLLHKSADVGIAVAMGDGNGLITPIVRAAETKGLAAIANEAKDLAERARAKKLKPIEFEGGTFSISNLGMFGIRDFTGVINPPHAAILAVGAGEQRPVVKAGALAIATVMTVRLSCDHRVIDGALGAQWLAAFKGIMEDPVTMLL